MVRPGTGSAVTGGGLESELASGPELGGLCVELARTALPISGGKAVPVSPTATASVSDVSSEDDVNLVDSHKATGRPLAQDSAARGCGACGAARAAAGVGGTQQALSMCKAPQAEEVSRPAPSKRALKVYGRLPKFSPFLGMFHHAPGAGNRSRASFFEEYLVTEEEHERRKRIKTNPFTGTFHYFPGRYSALHGLNRFRSDSRFLPSFGELDRLAALERRLARRVKDAENPMKTASLLVHLFETSAVGPSARASQYPHRSQASLELAGGSAETHSLDVKVAGVLRYRYGGSVDMLRKFGSSLDDGCYGNPSSPYREILFRWNGFRIWHMRTHPPLPLIRGPPLRSESLGSMHTLALTQQPQPPHQRTRTISMERCLSMPAGFGLLSSDIPRAEPKAPARAPRRSPSRALEVLSGGGGTEATLAAWSCPMQEQSLLRRAKSCSQYRNTSLPPCPGGARVPFGSGALVVQQCVHILDKYNVQKEEVLGEGSFASVFAAVHRDTGQSVAVKAIKRRYLFSEEDQASVRNEIDNMFRVAGHRNVLHLFETFETPDHIYLVVERATHGSLEQMLQLRRKVTELEAMWVVKQLLDAVEHLHRNGVLHCDLKPHNLLFSDLNGAASLGLSLTPREDAQRKMWLYTSPLGMILKLCDFGLSRKVPDVRYFKHTGDIHRVPFSRVCGTGGYIAPEIMQKQPYGKPADLWSVGVLTFRLLSGAMPFIPAVKCLTQQVSFKGRVWEQVSEDAKSFCRALLQVDQAKRATARDALGHRWLQTVPEWGPELLEAGPQKKGGVGGSA